MNYYRDKDYVINKKDEWFFIVPTSVYNNLVYIDYINDMNIFDLRKMSKKDILYYLNEINKIVREINVLGLQHLEEVKIDKLQNAEHNNDSKEFDSILSDTKEQVKKVNNDLKKCDNKGVTINKMFDIVISHITDDDFLKWIKVNYNLCYSCDSFSQVEKIYQEQKDKVRSTIMNSDEDKNVNLNEVASMPSNGIESVPDDPNVSYGGAQSDMTLNDVGLDPHLYDANKSNDTFIMDATPSYDNMDTTLHTGSDKGQGKSLTRRPGYTVGSFNPDENDGLGKAAFTNWYGIVLTLIFSFVIGYLIAWIILKVR